ncbi:MAG: hypothetical protein IH627_16030 [Rubrivivax sp.]|nr:hypothetical protein [Rubrivivax sp.]
MPGAAAPEYYAFVLAPAVITALDGMAWWAVMIFVWIAGIELDLSQAWRYRRESGISAGLALGVLLAFAVTALPILMDWQRVGKQALFLAAFAAAGWTFRCLMVRVAASARWTLGLAWLAARGLGTDWAGLHFMVGGAAVLIAAASLLAAAVAVASIMLTVPTVTPLLARLHGCRRWRPAGLRVFRTAVNGPDSEVRAEGPAFRPSVLCPGSR